MPIQDARAAAVRKLRFGLRKAVRSMPVALLQRLAPRPTFGACYHMVSHGRPRHVKHYAPLPVKEFEEDVRYLKRRFDLLAHDDLARRRSAGLAPADSTAVLTFDDGFAECATIVAPILQRHGVSATFFLVTDLVDNRTMFRESKASLLIDTVLGQPAETVLESLHELEREAEVPSWSPDASVRPAGFDLGVADLGTEPDPRLTGLVRWLLAAGPDDVQLLDLLCARLGVDVDGYLRSTRPYLSTEQILELHSQGFTIGAHTRSHPKLQRLTREDAEAEIVESCRIVRELTGQRSVPFAFPYSGWGLDRRWLAELRRQHDFIGLFFDTGGLRRDASFVVQRVFGERVSGARTMEEILRRAWADSL